jgi:hypothetical protein
MLGWMGQEDTIIKNNVQMDECCLTLKTTAYLHYTLLPNFAIGRPIQLEAVGYSF